MSRVDAFWGSFQRNHGDVEQTLNNTVGDSPAPLVPMHLAGYNKSEFEPENFAKRQAAIKGELMKPPELHDMDPRDLQATQGGLDREGLRHYLKDSPSGLYANQNNVGNEHPLVYTRDSDGANLLMSGHHRATVAMMKGENLKVRRVYGP